MDGEVEQAAEKVSMLGIFFGIFSSITTAMHAIVIKKSLDVVRGNTLELVWYNNLLSAVALMPLVVVAGEFGRVQDQLLDDIFDFDEGKPSVRPGALSPGMTFVLGTLLTGLFGFLINVAGFFQIKVTSPVTHMISSAVRGVLQTFLAVWLFSERLTTSRVVGIALILSGSTLYTHLKNKETSKNASNNCNVKPTPDEEMALTAVNGEDGKGQQ